MSFKYKSETLVTANSVTTNTGTPAGGASVSDVQNLGDGNVYEVAEVAGTPGYDIDFGFTDIKRIFSVLIRARYDGADNHAVTIRLRNYAGASDDIIGDLPYTNEGFITFMLPLSANDSNYIDGSNNAQVTFIHDSGGNAAHDVYIDYVAILGEADEGSAR